MPLQIVLVDQIRFIQEHYLAEGLVMTATGAIPAGSFELNCTSNIAKNGETGPVTFFIGSTKDTVPLSGQVVYTITL